LAFQQVHKYERGTNGLSAGKLHELSGILQVPVPYFFDWSTQSASDRPSTPLPTHVSDFLASDGGLELAKAFTQIGDAKLRRSLVRFVEKLGGGRDR
jgi:transcriptional regulator with XRE-family HTH domain